MLSRIAISRWRAVARASIRFATFDTAIKNTKKTAPESTQSNGRIFPTTSSRSANYREAEARVILRILALDFLRNRLHLGRGLVQRDPRLEPGDASHKERSATCGWVKSEDRPRFRIATEAIAVRRHDPDNRKRTAIHHDFLAHDGGARAIAAPPQALAYDYALTAAGLVVARGEGASQKRPDRQSLKEGRRDAHAGDLLGLTVAHERETLVSDGIERVEGTSPGSPVEEVGDTRRPAFQALLLERVEDHHETVGIGVGQRTQQNAVEHAEYRCVCADAQDQRTQGGESKSGIVGQRANGITEVPDQVINDIHVVHIATLLCVVRCRQSRAGQLVAPPPACGQRRSRNRSAVRGEAQFFIQLPFDLGAAKKGPQP